MKTKVFSIRRLGGESLLLHPFGVASDFFALGSRGSGQERERSEIEILFRDIPGALESAALRPRLETALRSGLKEWLLDRGFIPRVAFGTLAFVVLYLFFSIVVRDPVPVLDEFSIGAIGAFIAWKWLSSRSLGSSLAAATAGWAEKQLETASYRGSGAVAWFEDRLAELDANPAPDLLVWLEAPSSPHDLEDRADLASLKNAFARYLCRSSLFGPENPALVKNRARTVLGLDRPLVRRRISIPASGRTALYALYLKTCAELGE
jgi:hypothetical protein